MDAPTAPSPTPPRSAYARLYQRVVGLANSPYALVALIAVSIADASIFPIPPFALLLPMVAANPKRWLPLATVGTVASFGGGILGYYLGVLVHEGAISFLNIDLNFPIRSRAFGVDSTLGQLLGERFWILTLLCTVLPTPFKFVTIGSGLVSVPFSSFLLASAIGRAARMYGFSFPAFLVGLRAQRSKLAEAGAETKPQRSLGDVGVASRPPPT